MFERFTEQARLAVVLAQEGARAVHDQCIDGAHLLFGLAAAGGPGGQVFANNGCTACHTLAAAQSTGNVGPNLDDEIAQDPPSFIKQSIVDPSAEIAAGFNDGIMPQNYEQTIPAPDLEKLVNFLSTCAGAGDPSKLKFASDGSCVGGK